MLPLILGMAGAYALMGGAKTNPRRRKAKRRNPGLADPEKSVYAQRRKVRGYTGRVNLFGLHAVSAQKAFVKRLFPEWSKEQHLKEAERHRKAVSRYQNLWYRAQRKAHLETFGKEPTGFDYRVSGVGRDEYPERYKRVLRMAAHRGTKHATIGNAHLAAAGRLDRAGRTRANPSRRRGKRSRVSPSTAAGRLAWWRWHHNPGHRVGFADLARMSESDLWSFWTRHQRGRNARALGYTGTGSRRLVADLANYASNLATARDCSRRGDAQGAKMYKRICTTIRSRHRNRR